jgi:hypothetical protein
MLDHLYSSNGEFYHSDDFRQIEFDGEIDTQERQTIMRMSKPKSVVKDFLNEAYGGKKVFGEEPGPLWSDRDLEEMSKGSPNTNNNVKPEEGSSCKEEEIKTRIQITLKNKGKNVKGHSGNFVVHGIKVCDIMKELSLLRDKYPKMKGAEYTVRVQFTEYKSGKNIHLNGGNMNLHNAYVKSVIRIISDRLTSVGFTLYDKGWFRKNGRPDTTKKRDLHEVAQRVLELCKECKRDL